MTPAQATEFLKQRLRNGKTGELNKIVIQLCQAKRLDHSILDARYEAKMEELKSKFNNSAKMNANYEIYRRKRLAII